MKYPSLYLFNVWTPRKINYVETDRSDKSYDISRFTM